MYCRCESLGSDTILQHLDPVGTEMLLRHIYVGQKYSHIYTLSISTCKNQSTKVRDALYILIYEYNYKVIIRCDTIF